jgi:hypothetical protein
MAIEWDPNLCVNLVLCIIIVLLGLLCYTGEIPNLFPCLSLLRLACLAFRMP